MDWLFEIPNGPADAPGSFDPHSGLRPASFDWNSDPGLVVKGGDHPFFLPDGPETPVDDVIVNGVRPNFACP